MGFVVDSSLAAAWIIADESSPETDALARRLPEENIVAPVLWRFEVANVLLQGFKRRRLSQGAANDQLSQALSLPISFEPLPDEQAMLAIWHLSGDHGLTFYDATYLDLAIRRSQPLATLDRALVSACKTRGVPTLP